MVNILNYEGNMCNLCVLYDFESDCCSKEVVCFECNGDGEYTGARCIFDEQLDNLFEPITSDHKIIKENNKRLESKIKKQEDIISEIKKELRVIKKENKILKERLTKIS